MKSSSRTVTISFTAGLILIVAALGLFAYNSWEDKIAGEQANSLLAEVRQSITVAEPATTGETHIPDTAEETDTDSSIYGAVGILSIPDLSLELPVLGETSDPNLEISICRYSGSAASRMVIAGHNYRSHFGNLSSLTAGSPVVFTGLDGAVHSYQVSETGLIDATDFDALESGDWDMTLFTCNLARDKRILVRLKSTDTP